MKSKFGFHPFKVCSVLLLLFLSFAFAVQTRAQTAPAQKLSRRAIDHVKILLPPENEEESEADFRKNPIGYSGIWDSIWETVTKIMVQTPERTRRAIILLSDGDDTSSQVDRDEAADLALKNNVV